MRGKAFRNVTASPFLIFPAAHAATLPGRAGVKVRGVAKYAFAPEASRNLSFEHRHTVSPKNITFRPKARPKAVTAQAPGQANNGQNAAFKLQTLL